MTQKRIAFIPALAVLALTLSLIAGGVASAVTAGSQVYEGLVKHVSTSDLKVYNPSTKKTLSFVLVPRFGNVFKSDGRTPVQVKDLAAGQYVKVYYDQKALGVVHADRILIMSSSNVPMTTNKS
jgi:hypothetical protein